MAELQTVIFKAAKTNSAPPPLDVKRRGNDGPLLIGLFNASGFAWLLWDHRAVALVAAACVAGISIAMRKNHWLRDLSWILSCVVICALLIAPPTLPTKTWLSAHRGTEQVAKELRTASIACERTGTVRDCGRRQALIFEMGDSRRIEDRAKEVPPAAPIDIAQGSILYLLAAALLYVGHRIAGEPDTVAPSEPKPETKPEDPEAKIKRDGLSRWLKSGRISIGPGTESEPVDRVFEEYQKFLKETQITPPPAYDIVGFKKAFKDATNREPQEVKGIMVYVGVTFPGSGLG
jgi:hypothetical protein